MVFITFFGFSAIAAAAGEIKDPVRTVPRAIFASMVVVTLLYSLVVLVVVAAGLNEYTEAAMGQAAKRFLGSVGGLIIVAGALFSMISASNASILAGSRVMLAMARTGHLPPGFASVSPATRTPIVALIIVGVTTMLFTTSLSLEELAHFADSLLLTVLILVNVALILHRRMYPEMGRPFRVPLVPLLPGLGALANLYLLAQLVHHLGPVAMAGTCVLFGVLGFFAWKGMEPAEAALPGAPSRVALERSAADVQRPFRVLVALANPANVPPLVALASLIAKERNGQLIALRVALVPEQTPPRLADPYVEREQEILQRAHAISLAYDVPVTSLIRVGHNAARAILETSSERDCDLILLGWKGYTTTARRILGEVVDAVVHHARADVMLVKQIGPNPPRSFLLPTAGGEHARCAQEYVAAIARSCAGSLTICTVVRPDASEKEITEADQLLEEAEKAAKKQGVADVSTRIVYHHTVVGGVLQQSHDYDAVVVGAAGGSPYSQMLFGAIPERLARQCPKTVILVKKYTPVKSLVERVIRE